MRKQRYWEDADRFKRKIRKNDWEDQSKVTTKVIKVTDEIKLMKHIRKAIRMLLTRLVNAIRLNGVEVELKLIEK